MLFQEFALETIIVECNFKNLLWKQLLLNAISRIYSGNNYSWMQPQEFALETIIVERNLKNLLLKQLELNAISRMLQSREEHFN